MRRLPAFLLWALLPAVLAAQAPTTFTVRADASPCLNIRSSPESDAAAFTCMPPGTQVEGVGTAPYWRQVRLADGRIGWAAKKYLEAGAVAGPPAAAADRDDAWLEIHVVDVGQGDGIWIHTFDDNVPGNGRYEGLNIVIDGGPNSADASNEFLKYLLDRAHPGAVVDAMIITHPHDDHYPGAKGILRRFEVREFYDSGYPKDGQDWPRFLALVDSETAGGQPMVKHVGRATFGTPGWGSELDIRFLYAYPGVSDGLGSGNTLENNASIVLRIIYGTQRILLMGDAEGKEREDSAAAAQYVERWLLDSVGSADLRSTVLKIAHHGSETSNTTPFIEAVDPDYVIVSSGRRKFGGRFLPDASTLQRYCAHKASTRIYRTDQDDEVEGRTAATDADGDHVIIRTNGKVTAIEAFSGGQAISQTSCVA
jgi:beta-lactamase superfamily II metal-dependent hydrolase